MRENKVRIWDGNKYYYPECDKDQGNHFIQLGSNGYFCLYNSDGGFIVDSETGFIEYFTGLIDKNCVEIYEGDIVKKVIEIEGGIINNWQVFFGEAGFDIKRTKENGEETTMYLKKYWKHTYEVIGNIHENQELLQQPKVN